MSTNTDERFFVDLRGGCVAVRDRTETDPDNQGLHYYTEGVVKFWMGLHDALLGWSVDPEDIAKAHELCTLLNAGCAALAEPATESKASD